MIRILPGIRVERSIYRSLQIVISIKTGSFMKNICTRKFSTNFFCSVATSVMDTKKL